ncbi:Fic family protein [Ketogulonicigenium vulgare]|uniref:Filamentation induced by cAMP protein Fic n=1 Tax=Ketogulonicigenium vulgare (strain WSH-001) TaxID=759362 RepID=F9YB35_KETVW|nr:Fic family protein [Ketogulonicigenium vulgare]ADO44061.1 filamentation induced by cAMP protein Fic [Ketogulonicigenium vulgare Y25]AEM42587.1 Filamentation induced by cAMP protein Fic [Ketogulonicigenium vulgare WSH-001]ALJ82615.1 cell filamentation protein Fic [Ketogulonicigenium vulgare]ANW35369.1 cell filamentation protein Fic [Ketogulonicigenium vulgare]AOZ53287.1 filamentation induced by cAMP protein Fic [Ketogulonicigenium vulgare]
MPRSKTPADQKQAHQKLTGQAALVSLLGLRVPAPHVTSTTGPGRRQTTWQDGRLHEHYIASYDPGTEVFDHLRFALKYEALDMGVMAAAMRAMDPIALADWVRGSPSGQYTRRAWFFYERLTGQLLDLPDVAVASYIPALRPDLHITGAPTRSARHKVEDNLLGHGDFCLTVRRTPLIEGYIAQDLGRLGRDVLNACPPDLLARAVNYLYTKETKTSFAIEHEVPSVAKADRFVASLKMADRFSLDDPNALIALQNQIVDPRYRAESLRDFQNFVGETVGFDYTEQVHFICPRPADLPDLMADWRAFSARVIAEVDPVIAAALSAFTFVFLHPFEDGNGRIHRFLIHKILSDRGFTPPGMLFPVSAAILRDRHGYDRCLEAFSGAIQPLIDWHWTPARAVAVTNETAHLYRYFDATAQVEYLFDRISNTIEVDLRQEIAFIDRFDRAYTAVQALIDMPDARARQLTTLILQNGGTLSKAKRALFAEITDAEIAAIEAAIS